MNRSGTTPGQRFYPPKVRATHLRETPGDAILFLSGRSMPMGVGAFTTRGPWTADRGCNEAKLFTSFARRFPAILARPRGRIDSKPLEAARTHWRPAGGLVRGPRVLPDRNSMGAGVQAANRLRTGPRIGASHWS